MIWSLCRLWSINYDEVLTVFEGELIYEMSGLAIVLA